MKYLGIDFGTKQIGVAISDDGGKLAFPLANVPSNREALSKVVALARENRAGKIILGESKDFKNEPNPVMEDIEQFKKDLEELSELAVEYEPEFFTSVQALRQAQDKRGKGGVSSENIDSSAAALILQSYLDRNKVE